MHELSSLSSCGSREKPSREMETKQPGFSVKDKKEQILADFTTEIQKHEFQANSNETSIQELNGIIESQAKRT